MSSWVASALESFGAVLVALGLATLRLAPLGMALPVFASRMLPTVARVPVLAVLAIGCAPAILYAPVEALGAQFLVVAALREIALGVVLALVIATPFFALEQGGRLLDTARGANIAEVIAPDTGERASPLSELLRWTYAAVFLGSGGLRATMRVFAASYETVPPTARIATWLDTRMLADTAARWSADALAASVTLVSAGLLATVVTEFVLAVALRQLPSAIQGAVALPVRALVPLAALAVSVGIWTGATQELARRAFDAAGHIGGP